MVRRRRFIAALVLGAWLVSGGLQAYAQVVLNNLNINNDQTLTYNEDVTVNGNVSLGRNATLRIISANGVDGGVLIINLGNGQSLVLGQDATINLNANANGGHGGTLTVHNIGNNTDIDFDRGSSILANGLTTGRGGVITLVADDINFNNNGTITLHARGGNGGEGGMITLRQDSGLMQVNRSVEMRTSGLASATQNLITIEADALDMDAQLYADGIVNSAGGTIRLVSNNGDLRIRQDGAIHARGSGSGTGGTVELSGSNGAQSLGVGTCNGPPCNGGPYSVIGISDRNGGTRIDVAGGGGGSSGVIRIGRSTSGAIDQNMGNLHSNAIVGAGEVYFGDDGGNTTTLTMANLNAASFNNADPVVHLQASADVTVTNNNTFSTVHSTSSGGNILLASNGGPTVTVNSATGTVNMVGNNVTLGTYADPISVGGTTHFTATGDVTGAGSFSGAVSGTAGRVGIEATSGNFTSGGLTATSSDGWYGAADESMIIMTRNGSILGSGYTTSGAANIRLQAGTPTTLNPANRINVNNVSAAQNLALYATGVQGGTSVRVGTGSVAGHITATGLNASNERAPLLGGADITISGGDLTTAAIWSDSGNVSLRAPNGSILQNAGVYANMNGKTVRAQGNVTLRAGAGYIDTGVMTLGAGNNLVARAAGQNGSGVSVNLLGRVDGNVTVTNLTGGNTTGRVNLGTDVGDIDDLNSTFSVFDVGGNTFVRANGDVHLHGGFGLHGGSLNINGNRLVARLDKGNALIDQITASAVAGNAVDIRGYLQAAITGGDISTAGTSNIYLQAGKDWPRDKMSHVNLSNVNTGGNVDIVVIGSDNGMASGNSVVITGSSIGGAVNVTGESGGTPLGNVIVSP